MMACAIENNYVHKRIAISFLKLVGSDPKMYVNWIEYICLLLEV